MDNNWTLGNGTLYQLYYNNPFSQRVIPGWYQNTMIFALDLGEVHPPTITTAPPPLYIPITGFDKDGVPKTVEGQCYIFSKLPLHRGYTGFCQVVFTYVPPTYTPNTLRCQRDVLTGGYETFAADLILLLPVL